MKTNGLKRGSVTLCSNDLIGRKYQDDASNFTVFRQIIEK